MLVHQCMPQAHPGQKVGVKSSGTGGTDHYESQRGCWELSHYPLKEQKILLGIDPTLKSLIQS